MKELNNRVELLFIKDANIVTKKLSALFFYYDIFILDFENEESLMLSQNIRKCNLNASLIFVIHNNIKQILRIKLYEYKLSKVRINMNLNITENKVEAIKKYIKEQNFSQHIDGILQNEE